MEIPTTIKNSIKFLEFSIVGVLIFWLLSSTALYWHSPYETIALYECRWLLSSLIVTCFFVCLFINVASSVMFTATYVAAQCSFTYSVVSVLFVIINILHVLIAWPSKNQNMTEYLQLSFVIGFLSFVSSLITYYLIKNLIKMAHILDGNLQPIARRHNVMICSAIHFIIGLVDFTICYGMDENAPYASSFIVQQVCCASLSLSVAYMQWYFRDACNVHILRSIVIMNVCLFINELSHTYGTYLLIVITGLRNEFNSTTKTRDGVEVYLLISSLVVHGIRLSVCTYSIIVLAKEAFPTEILSRVRFLPNPQRGISVMKADQDNYSDARNSKFLFYAATILTFSCLATDIAYNFLPGVKRITGSGISPIYTICLIVIFYYYRKERRAVLLKLSAILSIGVFSSSIYTFFVFIGAVFYDHLYPIIIASTYNFLINGSYFLVSLGLIVLSTKSVMFCFRTIMHHTPFRAQSTDIESQLYWLTKLAYSLLTVLITEIVFTIIMHKLFSTKTDLVLSTELFLWLTSLPTCLLQLWICKYKRLQQCLVMLIVQLIADCSTILLLLTVQAGVVQAVTAVITRNGKTYQNGPARITYIITDHILQIIQWLLNICSLGLSLIILDKTAMECDLSESAMIDNLFDNEIFRLERMDEFVTTEQNTDIDYTRPSIYHEPADYYWGDNGDTLASEHHGSSEITGNSPVQSADDENDNISRGDNSRFTTTTQTVSCEVLNNNQSDIVDTGEIEEAAEHSDRNNDCNHDKLTHEVDDVDDDRDGESNNNDDVGDIDDADNDSI